LSGTGVWHAGITTTATATAASATAAACGGGRVWRGGGVAGASRRANIGQHWLFDGSVRQGPQLAGVEGTSRSQRGDQTDTRR
jgi:hypothetical protein